MYNGIGLNTARGSGTNGYVQRNLSFVNPNKQRITYQSEEDIRKKEAESRTGPNLEILEHARKRALELKCVEMEDVLLEEGYTKDEVLERVSEFRKLLMEREEKSKKALENDPNFTGSKETHAVAAAKLQKNARLKEAFGISEYFVEGSSLDPDRKLKEEAARQLKQQEEEERAQESLKKKYEWVKTPSPSPERVVEKKQKKEKKEKKDKKKSKKKRDRSPSPEPRKRHKSKKSKRSR